MINSSIENATTQLGFGARVYERDVEHLKPENTTLQKIQRTVVIALPFVSLCKPLGAAISTGMNTARGFSCLVQTKESFTNADKITQDKAVALFQTAIAISAIAGTVFGSIYGMAITSGHDVLMSLYEMMQCIQKGETEKALEKFLQLVTNSLYLTTIVYGSLEIIVISFAAQILLEIFKSQGLFRKFKETKDILDLLEGFAHLGMTGVRIHQMQPMLQMLQFKSLVAKAIKKHQIIEKQTAKVKQSTEQPKQQASNRMKPSILKKQTVSTADNKVNSTTSETIDGIASGAISKGVVAYCCASKEKQPNLVSFDHPFCQAVWRGDLDAVRKMVNDGADVNMRYYEWDDPLEHCGDYLSDTIPLIFLALPHPEILQFLIDSGSDINAITCSGLGAYNILHHAIFSIATNDDDIFMYSYIPIESLHIILEAGCPVNSVIDNLMSEEEYEEYDKSHLEYWGGTPESIRKLLMGSFSGYTPLHIAAKKGCGECILALLEHGADIDALNDQGLKPYQIAHFNNFGKLTEDTLDGFIKIGVDINDPSFLQDYLIHKYAEDLYPIEEYLSEELRVERKKLNDRIIALINEGKININARTGTTGRTIFLIMASYYSFSKQEDVLKWLLDCGADINAKDNQGQTALDITKKIHNFKLAEWLLAHGAQ